MVELCGVDVVQQDVEEREGFKTSLVGENMRGDAGEKTTWLGTNCGRTSVDQDFNIPSRFNTADAGRGEVSTQCDEQRIGSPAGIVREVNFEGRNEYCKEELAMRVSELSLKFVYKFEENKQNDHNVVLLENSLLNVIERKAETDNCCQVSYKNGPSEILDGIGSLSFHVEDDDTKLPDVNLEFSTFCLSLPGQHDGTSQSELNEACTPSLKKEVLVQDNHTSCLDFSHPRFGDVTVNSAGSNDIRNDCHQHHGPKDWHHMSLSASDETTKPDAFDICQKSHLEHSGCSLEALLLDYVPDTSSQHAFRKDEMHFIEACAEKWREHQMCDKQSSVHESSQKLLQGLPNVSGDSFVKKTETVSSPLTAVEIAPSVHSPHSFIVASNRDPVNGSALHIREQVSHAFVKQATLAERIHMSGMGSTSAQIARHTVNKDKVAKRGRRSSKAVKFDECMKSFSVVSRKKRSYFSKPARSYIWWSSGAILQSPNIDRVTAAGKSVSQGECGFSKSKKVCEKREPGSTVFGDKDSTPSTHAPVEAQTTRGVDKTSLRAVVPDIHGCSPPQTTDHAFDLVKKCSEQLKGECNMTFNRTKRIIWPLQADYAFVNSKQADIVHDTLKLDDNHNHAFQNHDGITHDATGGAANVYLTTALQDDVTAVEENVENSFLDAETSPDSEVIDTIPEICLAGRAEEDTAKDVPLTSSGYFGIQGGATSINFTYSSRKKGKKKEMRVFASNCSPASPSANFTSFVPVHNFDATTNNSKCIEPSESISGILNSGIKSINTLPHYPSLDNMASEIKETCPDRILKLGNHFTSGAQYAVKDKSDSDVPDAWASCDICDKWRRIPSTLADYIARTNCRWTCNENSNKAFADCSIPQEKSDHAINIELELSDCGEDVDEISEATELKKKRSNAAERERWTSIKTNSYLHRKRKNQTIDEIMVCHCKPPRDGGLGCEEECLNRMLNIECDRRTCPCGDLCSNHQFQERKYAKLKSFKCGKKGYGLRSEENIGRGQFLIEYVGEVLDMPAYEARQKDYALKGHKHFYFMTLNGSEVIDACSKGNLGRYINHSCEPNCRTEKWMVNGEICIGLFAIRNIKKGEEITFDYNYVRVFGAAAKKCKCGSSQCRGFIGGDPLNCEVVAYDSDEEDSEELEADKESNTFGFDERISTTKNTSSDENQDAVISTVNERAHLEDHGETETSGDASTSSFLLSEIIEDSNETMHLTQPLCIPNAEGTLSKYSFSGIEIGIKEKVSSIACKPFKSESSSLTEGLGNDASLKTSLDSAEVDQEPPRSAAPRKLRISSGSLTKTNNKAPKIRLKKSEKITSTSKKSPIVSGRHEVVQEKLNELLDSGGGISKRRESPKGYLKLLILTTASDNSGNGEAIQSNRDLSMILDALLKTKSRAVLGDIINKNGLRMLHNMMKQYRRDFNRTPILRMLLKILEYLAENRILTSDQINGGPPCPGMESFAESVLALTEHRNRQVYQIARSFRDKWIRRPTRKFSCKDEGNSDFLRGSRDWKYLASQSNRTDSPKNSTPQIYKVVNSSTQDDGKRHEGCLASSVNKFVTSGWTGRKRKSRWDQDEWVRRDGTCVCHNDLKAQYPNTSELSRLKEADEVASISMNTMNVKKIIVNSEVLNMDEDLPPGFSAPCQDHGISSASPLKDDLGSQSINWTPDPSEVVQGHPLRKFMSRSPVSYGIPVSIVDQDVTSQNGIAVDWEISPSLPFHPFPPLPLLPRTTIISPPGFSAVSVTMEVPESCISPSSANHIKQISSGASTAFVGGCHINRQYFHKRPRGSTEGLDNSFFRQKKLMIPPWMCRRQGGFVQNNPRNMICKGEVRNLSHSVRNQCADNGSSRTEAAGNMLRQDQEHQH